MSYLTKDGDGLTCFSDKAKKDYKKTPLEYRDGVLMDMLGEMTFGCGKTRWDSPILFTHIDSRKIVVAVKCPSADVGWNGCPYTPQTPGKHFAFVHEQSYEIRIMGEVNGFKTIVYEEDFPSNMLGGMHWFELPKNIRKAWQASNRTASMKIQVSISTGAPRNKVERMTFQELLSMVKSQATGRCVVNIVPNGERSKINFICPDNHWSCNVSLFEFALAVEESHSSEMDGLYMNVGIYDLEDRFEGDVDIAYAIKDYLETSRGSFGGGLGRGWLVEVI